VLATTVLDALAAQSTHHITLIYSSLWVALCTLQASETSLSALPSQTGHLLLASFAEQRSLHPKPVIAPPTFTFTATGGQPIITTLPVLLRRDIVLQRTDGLLSPGVPFYCHHPVS
jgi:hypothetical protein